MRVINLFLYSLIPNLNYLFLFSSFTARDHGHAFIDVVAFVIARFLKDMQFMATAFMMINYLDLVNHHLSRLLILFLLLYRRYLLLSFLIQNSCLKEG